MSITPKRNARSPSDMDRVVGQNVRRLRVERNLTLVELAEVLHISQQQLQKYETGANRLSAGTISSLAEALSVPIETLFVIPGKKSVRRDSDRSGSLDKLRQQGVYWLDRTKSEATLKQMVDILKVLATKP
jgi:transcriptional regulator with XRE-family HTH domain